MVRSGVLSVPRKWPRVQATSLEPSRSIRLLSCFLTLHFFLSDKKNPPGSNPLVGFLAHATAADACTELIELAFETKKLPIGKGICERLRKTSHLEDEGRYRHDKITHDEPTRVATKDICSRLSLARYLTDKIYIKQLTICYLFLFYI